MAAARGYLQPGDAAPDFKVIIYVEYHISLISIPSWIMSPTP